MQRSDEINELAAALAKAQAEMAAAAKDSANPFFNSKYADLASCWESWRPAGPKHGLALIQLPTSRYERLDPPIVVQGDDNRRPKTIHFVQYVGVETILAHSSGQWISEKLEILVKDDSAQATMSGETYGRRGGMTAMTGIAPDDDDDGNSAANHGTEIHREPKPAKPPCPECGKSQFVLKDKEGPGFFCWKNHEKEKFGCGNKWVPGEHPPEVTSEMPDDRRPVDKPAPAKPKLHAGLDAVLTAMAGKDSAKRKAIVLDFGVDPMLCLEDPKIAASLQDNINERCKAIEKEHGMNHAEALRYLTALILNPKA